MLREPALTVGGAMPTLPFRTADGTTATLRPAAEGPTAVLLFHSRCGHCHTRLDALNREQARLEGTKWLLLSTEDSLPVAEIRSRWPALHGVPGVRWGTVRASDFAREFGTLVTPTVFAFGTDGRLRQVVQGEARVDFLSRALRS